MGLELNMQNNKFRQWSSRERSSRPVLSKLSLSPSRLAAPELFVGSFLLLIALGTLLLALLPGVIKSHDQLDFSHQSLSPSDLNLSPVISSIAHPKLDWVDAAFTATSAVCVTGLIVVDTASFFTPLGQAILLGLIQCGGIGMLVISSVVISLLGGRPSIRTESMAHSMSHLTPKIPIAKLISHVLLFSLVVEALGALALFVVWAPRLGWREAIWPSIFHSISAFCNAGFSTNSDSLVSFQESPASLLIISALIIVGGIGFVTLEENYQRFSFGRSPRKQMRRISIHSKLVLLTTGILLLLPTPIFALLEWNGVLSNMSQEGKWVNSFFMSVTPRTAGFNSVDYSLASDSTNFLTMLLMFIGGSPGSTAGGLKTTTLALLVLFAWARVRGYRTCVFNYRSVPDETVNRATTLFTLMSGLTLLSILLVSVFERSNPGSYSLLAYAFEVASALGTVGMSMGVTAHLTDGTKILLILLMIAGRTGPLVIASILIYRLTRRERHRYAYEDIVVG